MSSFIEHSTPSSNEPIISLGEIIRRREEGMLEIPVLKKEKHEEENVIYIDSFYIPRMPEEMTLEELVNIIETSSPYKGSEDFDNSIGVVERIDSIPKISSKDGETFKSAFVVLKSWSDNKYAKSLMMKLYNDQQSRVYYNLNENINPQYLVILPNKSETSLLEPPKHTDLMIYYVPTEISLQTVFNVFQGLDIGKIHSIEAELSPEHDHMPFDYDSLPKWINQTIWNQSFKPQYNTIYIRMEYWYKTQAAYAFEREMMNNSCVHIPTYNGIVWTIYECDPIFEGTNPYVWTSM